MFLITRKPVVIWTALIAGCLSCISIAQGSEKLLRDFFDNVQNLEANFTQEVEDETGSVLERASGKFYLSRPGKFRWDYNGGDSGYGSENIDAENGVGEAIGQQIVADGSSLYFYDPDLEQVSQRSLDDALAQVPSLLLVQTGANVDKHFVITDFGLTDGLSWVSLTPKNEDAGYKKLMVGFDGPLLSSLMLYDGLGNSTELQLRQVQVNNELAASVFEFIVPEGADVLSDQ